MNMKGARSPMSRAANVALSVVFFFFSSRRRHTRFDCDWSSDVCSSDLLYYALVKSGTTPRAYPGVYASDLANFVIPTGLTHIGRGHFQPIAQTFRRSEERRVGKECRSRWSPYH